MSWLWVMVLFGVVMGDLSRVFENIRQRRGILTHDKENIKYEVMIYLSQHRS
jgi:hypothetical protein